MNTLLRIILGLMLTAVIIASCEDDNDTADNTTTQQKLQNKWLIDSTSLRTVTEISDNTVTQPGAATDYYDFRNDNKLYFQVSPNPADTVPYLLINDQQVVIDGDTATIETLTQNKLIGSRKIQLTASSYTIIKSYLRR